MSDESDCRWCERRAGDTRCIYHGEFDLEREREDLTRLVVEGDEVVGVKDPNDPLADAMCKHGVDIEDWR